MTMEHLKDWSQFISTVGFPVVVAGYVLVRMDKTVSGLTTAITKLTALIEAKLK